MRLPRQFYYLGVLAVLVAALWGINELSQYDFSKATLAWRDKADKPKAPSTRRAAARPATRPANLLGSMAVDTGLEWITFQAPIRSTVGDSVISILRIDPRCYSFRLLNASAPAYGQPLTAKEWCQRYGLSAAINAGLFKADGRTACAFMRAGAHVNNAAFTNDKAMLAFDRLDATSPLVQVADLERQPVAQLGPHYASMAQGIRMITAERRNVWSPQPKAWSAAAVASDGAGRILFIFVRSPYTMHDLANMLLRLPLDVRTTMYVEGGPEAQLYFTSPAGELELMGSYETGFNENDTNRQAYPVPNVIGIVKKQPPLAAQ